MHRQAYKLPLDEDDEAVDVGSRETEHDPYEYGWRERREIGPDGTEKLRWDPLTYQDLLDPQEGDAVAEDSIHRSVTEDVARILRRRYERQPTVAVWCNLKIRFVIPGLTTGPGPDICVVEGVHDRDLRRTSFRFGEEPGKVRLVIEIVSKNSVKKDYRDLLAIYGPLGVEEYFAIRPVGFYSEGPFRLRGWRRDTKTGRLRLLRPDAQGRLRSRVTGLLFGTREAGWGLEVWDAATGERLRTSDEELEWHAERAAQAEERAGEAENRAFVAKDRAEEAEEQARLEAKARRAAEKRAEQEARRAEQEAEARRNAEAEVERLRALLRETADREASG